MKNNQSLQSTHLPTREEKIKTIYKKLGTPYLGQYAKSYRIDKVCYQHLMTGIALSRLAMQKHVSDMVKKVVQHTKGINKTAIQDDSDEVVNTLHEAVSSITHWLDNSSQW